MLFQVRPTEVSAATIEGIGPELATLRSIAKSSNAISVALPLISEMSSFRGFNQVEFNNASTFNCVKLKI
jgi:hypothetical protein